MSVHAKFLSSQIETKIELPCVGFMNFEIQRDSSFGHTNIGKNQAKIAKID